MPIAKPANLTITRLALLDSMRTNPCDGFVAHRKPKRVAREPKQFIRETSLVCYKLRTLFAGKAIEVIRVLLVDYPAELTLRAICGKAEVSLRWASVVANALIRENFALRESQKSALKIMAPLDLLKRWAAVNNFVANTKFADYYSKEEDVTKFFSQFKTKKGPKYALATLAGGLLTAPFVRPTNVHLYVKSKEDAKKWAERLGLMPVEKNGNVRFAIAESPGVFYGAREIDGVKVVSDVQLYVDLLNYPGRGEEAAQAVLRVIEKRWKEQKG